MILGCIADDFTGATDLASTLVRGGMRTVQLIGVPDGAVPDADAVVIALKSRTSPVAEAVGDSLAALRWLQAAGCRQVFQKYCSTFDSTDAGNIGPVADALVAALGCGFALACPAFPANNRSVFQGHLFVGTALLNESGMEHHPLTPDARRQPGASLVAPDRGHGRIGAVGHGQPGCAGDPTCDGRAQGTGPALRDRRRDHRGRPDGDRRGRSGACADHRWLGRRDGAARELSLGRAAPRAK